MNEKPLKDPPAVTEAAFTDTLCRALIRYSYDGIVVIDPERLVSYASPAYERILGAAPEATVGQPFEALLHPDDRVKMQLIFSHLGETPGNVIRIQWRQRHAGGSWRWLEGVGMNLRHVPDIGGLVMQFHDITERRLQDEALRLSETRLRQIIDLIPAYIYARDFAGRLILANDKADKIYRESASTRSEDTLQQDRDVILTGEMKLIPEENLCVDGETMQILRTYKIPYVSPDTGHPAALSVSMDITELKQAEEALSQSEAHLRAIFDTTDTSYTLINQQGIIVSANRLAHEWIGLETGAQGLVGRHFIDLAHAADRPQLREAFEKAIAGDTSHYEKCYPQPSGDSNWYDVRILPVGSEQERIGVCFAVSDISARKREEQRRRENEAHLELSQRIAHVGSWEADLRELDDLYANPLRWSDECFRIFGLEPGSVEVSNDLFYSMVHPDDREEIFATFNRAIATNRVYSIEHRIIRADGSERLVFERGEIFRDVHTGQRLKMIGTVHDITDQRQAEAERAQQLMDTLQLRQGL